MGEERKTRGIGFWAAVLLTVALVYPISLGPACWASSRFGGGNRFVSRLYQPIARIAFAEHCPETVGSCVSWYSMIGAKDGWLWQGEFRNLKWKWKFFDAWDEEDGALE